MANKKAVDTKIGAVSRKNPVGQNVEELNASIKSGDMVVSHNDKEVLRVLSLSISDDQEPTYKCVMEDGEKADVPATNFTVSA
jgi:hypothetical protein